MIKNCLKVREKNMYNEGETTHFNQPLIQCNVKRCWKECIERSDYYNRRKDIDIFNRYTFRLPFK